MLSDKKLMPTSLHPLTGADLSKSKISNRKRRMNWDFGFLLKKPS